MTDRHVLARRGSETLRVATFNILTPEHADWASRRTVAQTQLRELDADVVALQETTVGHGADQAKDLLGPEYHIVEHPALAANSIGAVLASRWPVGSVHEVDLRIPPRVPFAAAIVAEATLPAPFGPTFFAHHGAAYQFGFARERELQAVRTATFVEELLAGQEVHVVALGDFNDPPESASVRFWTGRQSLEGHSVAYQDAWEAVHPDDAGPTFSPDNPLVRSGQMPLERGRRIDYIMIRKVPHGPTLDVLDCQRICNQPINHVWASDHYGVMADLHTPPHPLGTWA